MFVKYRRGNTIRTDRSIFVISDLHIGDGSTRDNLEVRGRADSLRRFLDYVDSQQGELVIVGDLFEFWRYRLDKVVEKRRDLLDRFDALKAVYITGNHDSIPACQGDTSAVHPFFARRTEPYVCTIGSKRFKFMHGHEVDPFIPARPRGISRMFGAFWGMIEPQNEVCVVHRDVLSDTLFELGETLLKVWHVSASMTNRKLREYYSYNNDKFAWLKRSLRIQRMLSRYHTDKKNGLYDVAIVGHTHKAGRFSRWYYNCGSWTGQTNNFMRIEPEGHIQVLDWTENGHVENNSVIETQ